MKNIETSFKDLILFNLFVHFLVVNIEIGRLDIISFLAGYEPDLLPSITWSQSARVIILICQVFFFLVFL